MNKRLTILSIAALGISLASCEEQTEGNDHQEENVTTVDSSATIEENVETDPIEEATSQFEYFEDYASLTTRTALYDAFDASNLEDGISWYAEGTVQMEHTLLKNPENGHQIKFVWSQDDTEKLSSIEAFHNIYNENYEITGKQVIESTCGMFLGMSIKDLRDWNGEDFEFSGFGWDFQGGIFPNGGGKLAECKTIGHLNCDIMGDEYTFLLGDVALSTTDEAVMEAPIYLHDFTYYLP